MKKTTSAIWAGTLALGLAGTVQATLFDRGGGMIYDSDQDLTWLQDANYAFTSGYAAANAVDNGGFAHDNIFANGGMGWDAAMAWAEGLSYGGYDDWRLPTVTDNGNDGCNFSYNGTDCGYNVDTSGSELAYMWYDILENMAAYDISGNRQYAQFGFPSIRTGADGVDFLNLQPLDGYWSGTEYAQDTDIAWMFDTDTIFAGYGSQYPYGKSYKFFAWAVRSGDAVAVPEPGTVLLFGAGLIGLLGVGRRQRQHY